MSTFRSIICFCLVLTASSCFAADRLVLEPADGTGNGRHIVLVSGDEEYRTEESCPMLAKILSQHHGFKCTVLFAIDKETGRINPNEISNIPGTDALADADLMIIATRWRVLPDEQLKPILDYLKAAKPIVAYRTATHAFKSGHYGGYDWANFGINVIGENWLSHHGKHKVQGGRAVIVPENAKHPVLNSVSDIYTPSDIYGIKHLDQNKATVLLRGAVIEALDPNAAIVEGEINDPMMPLAWIKPYPSPSGETGQCFATTAGAAVDFLSEDLRRLIVNACFFLTEQTVPEKADVTFVDPFDPSFFGFQKGDFFEKRALKVEDFDLGKSTKVLQ
ncbi:ThuA domain-containing protein [Novipirellula artificiosorum]|uniref:Trehalose utilization n=1 Tax=Novipirellula artificiosorum TaxID=2528016 RepID=A0A5C6DN35_9BACT|nr:ThuA domain-containing protein [Novipirellula artificiosorum]TWU37071.1 Trehalose utilization [Novipirellula artificiosorum]